MLISFEGIDGVGKSTQIGLLSQWLALQGKPCIQAFEPGDNSLDINSLLSLPDIDPVARAFLYLADRAQHFAEIVHPALKSEKIVLVDRCIDSTVVYQRGVISEPVLELCNILATYGRSPDLTILLDMAPERISLRGSVSPAQESLTDQLFYGKIRERYLTLASRFPDRIKIVDADQPEAMVHQNILPYVKNLLNMQ